MQKYTLFLSLTASVLAQSTTYETSTSTTSIASSTTAVSSSAASPSQICGVAGYDLGNPVAAAYDGSGLRGTFETCKAWCTNYLSFAVGSGVCLCYPAPVVGNLNVVPASPNVYYDMSCPQPPAASSTSDSAASPTTVSITVSTTTSTFTLVSSTITSSTSSVSTTQTSAKSSSSSTSAQSSTTSSTKQTTTSATTTTQYQTTKATTSSAPTTFVTKTTTATTTTSAVSTAPTSACFKIKANGQYLALGSSLTSKLAFTTGTPSALYVDKNGILRNAADNYALMRSVSNLFNWNYGYISRIGVFTMTATKNTSAKTLTVSNWWNGAAPVWTSSKDSAPQHGANPGNSWTQVTVSYEDVTCPSTARV